VCIPLKNLDSESCLLSADELLKCQTALKQYKGFVHTDILTRLKNSCALHFYKIKEIANLSQAVTIHILLVNRIVVCKVQKNAISRKMMACHRFAKNASLVQRTSTLPGAVCT